MRRGVTLVELLIVVLIIVVLVAIALPTVKYSIEEGRLREGARQVNAFCAAARAQAESTGRPVGVWFELERIGDPAAAVGLHQCSQLYLAEVPPAYTGDVAGATCRVAIGRLNTPADNPPWTIDFQGSAAMLPTLVAVGETFQIRLDGKGDWFAARRTAAGFEIIGPSGGNRPPRIPGPGPDGKPGVAGVDDNGNGVTDHEAPTAATAVLILAKILTATECSTTIPTNIFGLAATIGRCWITVTKSAASRSAPASR